MLGVGDRFLIGCVGQICPRKNQVGLVELFAEALKSRPEMVLLIEGSALFPCNKPYEQRLHKRVHDLGISDSVRLLGSRDDVPLLLETMDMLVLPSINDPFPMIILESMAAGLPIAAYSIDGIPELIADGRTGWLVPPGDRMQMARTILWAERSPAQRRRFAETAHRAVLTNTLPAYANTFANILRARAVQSREHLQPLAPATDDASHSKCGAA
jgi:glycosyltransferase involved in cell wall biosynthesis